MRQVNYTFNVAAIDNAKPREKAYALTDGGGLQLEVLPSGSKTWRFNYHLNGKREKVTIGAYPAFAIKQALLTEQKLADARRLSFRTFAQRWVGETLFCRSGGSVAQTVRWLDVYFYPASGDMQLDEVQPVTHWPSSIEARADTDVTAERIRVRSTTPRSATCG